MCERPSFWITKRDLYENDHSLNASGLWGSHSFGAGEYSDALITPGVYRQRSLPSAAICGRVVGVRMSGVLAQAAKGTEAAGTWAA